MKSICDTYTIKRENHILHYNSLPIAWIALHNGRDVSHDLYKY